MRHGKVILAGVLSCVMAVSALGVTTQAKPKPGKIKFDKKSIVISKGKSAKLSIKRLGDKKVEWTVSNKSIAKVDNGKVTGIKAGKTVVNAKIEGVDKSLKCKVTVEEPYFEWDEYLVSEDEDELALELGGTKRKAKWVSSDEDIADIDKDGTIIPIEPGTVTVTAILPDGYRVTTEVTVLESDDDDDDGWDDEDDDEDWDDEDDDDDDDDDDDED